MGKTRVFRSVARHPMLRRYLPIVERKREREKKYSLQRGSFLLANFSLSLFLWTDRKHFKKRFEKEREEEEEEELEEGKKNVVPACTFSPA